MTYPRAGTFRPEVTLNKGLAQDLRHGQCIHKGICSRAIGPKGGIKDTVERWRVNGECQVWKTRPFDFRLPLKRGFIGPHEYAYNKERGGSNAHNFHREEDCPLTIMDKFLDLMNRARTSASELGHVFSRITVDNIPHPEARDGYTFACENCDMFVHVKPRPQPNEIDIGGPAIAQNCPARDTMGRGINGAPEVVGQVNVDRLPVPDGVNVLAQVDRQTLEPCPVCNPVGYITIVDHLGPFCELCEGERWVTQAVAAKYNAEHTVVEAQLPEGEASEWAKKDLQKAVSCIGDGCMAVDCPIHNVEFIEPEDNPSNNDNGPTDTILPDDGYADGGEPYTDEELALMDLEEAERLKAVQGLIHKNKVETD